MSTSALLPVSFPIPLMGRALVALALGVTVFFLCRTTPAIDTPSEAGVIMDLPSTVGIFRGTSQKVSEAELRILPKDTQFAKMLYQDPVRNAINCQIVLSGGEKRSIHRPEICLPGQGWTKKSGEAIPIQLDNGQTIKVMKLIISRPVEVRPGTFKQLTSVFLYWFVGKGMTTPYHWQRILHTDFDRVLHKVNHRWAYVVVSAPVLKDFEPGGKDEAQTLDMLKEFVGEVGPKIMKQAPAAQ